MRFQSIHNITYRSSSRRSSGLLVLGGSSMWLGAQTKTQTLIHIYKMDSSSKSICFAAVLYHMYILAVIRSQRDMHFIRIGNRWPWYWLRQGVLGHRRITKRVSHTIQVYVYIANGLWLILPRERKCKFENWSWN